MPLEHWARVLVCTALGCSNAAPSPEPRAHALPPAAAACEPGRADCNLHASDGCEVDLTRDSAHCGECARSCGYALCEAGVCGAAPEIIDTGQDGVCGMAADGSGVFWSNCRDGRIRWHAPGAGGPKTLATDQAWTVGLAVDDTHVWWSKMGNLAEKGAIRSVEKTGGPVSDVVTDDDVFGIALDEERVYWTRCWLTESGTKGAVMSKPKAGGTKSLIALTPGKEITVNDSAVFWNDPEASVILRRDKAGGEPLLIAETQGWVSALAAHGDFLFWGDAAGLFRASTAGGQVTSVDPAGDAIAFDSAGGAYYGTWSHIIEGVGSEARPLAAVVGSVGGMAVVGDFVYFGDFNQNVVVRVVR